MFVATMTICRGKWFLSLSSKCPKDFWRLLYVKSSSRWEGGIVNTRCFRRMLGGEGGGLIL